MPLSNEQLEERMRRRSFGGNPSYVGNIGFGGFENPDQNGPSSVAEYTMPTASTDRTNPANIAADLMQSDSRLMRAAETKGLQNANKRGLLNTSMAVGAAQDETLKAVVPLASQEAQQRFQDNSAKQGFGFDSILSRQDYEQRLDEGSQAFGFELDLEQMRQDQAREQAALDRQFELSFQDREFDARFNLADMDADIRRELMQMESDMRLRLADTEAALDSRNISMEAFLTARDQYNTRVTNIMNNPDMSAEEKADAIRSEQRNLDTDVRAIEDLYSVDLPWTEDYQPPNIGTANAGQVRRQIENFYSDIFGRNADLGGLNFYEQEVTSGRMTLDQVRSALLQSQEAGTVASSGQTTGQTSQQPSATQIRNDLRSAYQSILGRAPDTNGFNFWMGQLESGSATIADVRQALQQSDEGRGLVRFDPTTGTLVPIQQGGQQTGSTTPGLGQGSGMSTQDQVQALRDAYQNILGRAPDPEGFNFWRSQLVSGRATVEQMIQAFRESDEGKGLVRYNPTTQRLEPVR